MKKILILLIVFVMLLVSCGEMERAQYTKAREAEETGLNRNIRVYEQGELVWDFTGMCNLEMSETTGFLTITEKIENDILAHKIKASYQTLIIIEELGKKEE